MGHKEYGSRKAEVKERRRRSYVQIILKNRAVIGEYQPHQLSNGKRQPIGEPIPDYYPLIVDKDIFYRVQEQLKQNIHRGGQIGKVSNLFSHIVKGGYCGGSLAFVDTGAALRGVQYLVCDRARRGLGCSKITVKYKEVERLVLSYCKGLHAQDILDKNDETAINLLKNQHAGIVGELIADSIATTADKRVRHILEKRMTERLDNQAALNQTKNQLKQQIDTESGSFENLQLTLDSQRELINFLETEKADKKLIDVRLRLRNEMKNLIDRIVVYPEGLTSVTQESAQTALKEMSEFFPEGTKEYSDIKKYHQDRLEHPKEFRLFTIFFKSGSMRTIYPTREQCGIPLGFDFDNNEKVIRIQNLGLDGRLITEICDENRCIVKHYRRSKDSNDKEILHEIIDRESDKAQIIAEKASKCVQRAFK